MSQDMSGAIFNNDRKEKDTHPDRTGTCTIGGVDYWISGWLKKKDGRPYLSLAFKPKEAKVEKPAPTKPADKGMANFEDDIPF